MRLTLRTSLRASLYTLFSVVLFLSSSLVSLSLSLFHCVMGFVMGARTTYSILFLRVESCQWALAPFEPSRALRRLPRSSPRTDLQLASLRNALPILCVRFGYRSEHRRFRFENPLASILVRRRARILSRVRMGTKRSDVFVKEKIFNS